MVSTERECHVMLSSTMSDLKAERQVAHDAVVEAGAQPWWAEEPPSLFAGQPRDFCKQMAEQCDLFLLILGPNYGFTPEGQPGDAGQSITQMEFQWARAESKRKIRIFVRADALNTTDERQHKFISEVQEFESGFVRFPPFNST